MEPTEVPESSTPPLAGAERLSQFTTGKEEGGSEGGARRVGRREGGREGGKEGGKEGVMQRGGREELTVFC